MPIINEGLAKVQINNLVFYNPNMKKLRDISVCFLKALKSDKKNLLDSTSATGIRGIRYSLEAKIGRVIFLEINPSAYKNTKLNIKFNKIKGIALNKNIQEFSNTSQERFDIIDIDPFGGPAPYLYDLMKISKDNTALMVTATDTAVLCGAHPDACIKIYGSKPLHSELCKEVGIRILLNYISRTANQFNFGVVPLLSVSDMHYMRVFVRLRVGAQHSLSSAKETGFGSFCRKCHAFMYIKKTVPNLQRNCAYCKSDTENFGPLWLGNLYDKKLIKQMLLKKNKVSQESEDELKKIHNELDMPFFYSIPKITKSLKKGSISHYKIIERLKDLGYTASGTQFEKDGIKTDAEIRELINDAFA